MAVVVDVEAELGGAVDALCAADPAALADGETLVALHRQLERLAAVTTRAVAAFDAGRAWSEEGAHTASAWLRARWNVPATSARRRVKLGRALREMPAVEAAWLAGDIGEAQVALLASARTAETAACFERDEEMLVDQAAKLSYRSFARALAYWEQLADPDGTERSAERQHADRRLHLSQTFGGRLGTARPPRPDQRGHRCQRAGADRQGAVRGRLGRSQSAGGRRGVRR